jgi:Domain of unknown function DUF1828
MDILATLKSEFNDHIGFREKRPGIMQVIAPLFHEDGDMLDIFLDLQKEPGAPIRISDHGMTLMRLSYSYELDSPTRRKILGRFLSENGVSEERGRMFMETTPDRVYPTLLQFAQVIAKITSMHAFKREIVQSLFYEMLDEYIEGSLSAYHPHKDFLPIPSRGELDVDWCFPLRGRPIFLYGVKESGKARLAALACRELQIAKVPFRSVIVHEDFENGLNKKDQARITNAADKQFTTLTDFTQNAQEYFEREADTRTAQ